MQLLIPILSTISTVALPNILILDEPTNALDHTSVLKLKDYLITFMKNPNHMLIFTNHTNDEVSALFDLRLDIDNHGIREIPSS